MIFYLCISGIPYHQMILQGYCSLQYMRDAEAQKNDTLTFPQFQQNIFKGTSHLVPGQGYESALKPQPIWGVPRIFCLTKFILLLLYSPGSFHFAVEMKSQRWAWVAVGWRERTEPSWQRRGPVWPPWWCPCWTACWWPSWPTWQQCPAGLQQRPRPRVPSYSLHTVFHLELFIWKRWPYMLPTEPSYAPPESQNGH